jgi:hypothetical protein
VLTRHKGTALMRSGRARDEFCTHQMAEAGIITVLESIRERSDER